MNEPKTTNPTAKPPTRQGLPDDQPIEEEQRRTEAPPKLGDDPSIPYLPVG
ncbi:MAG TPA: hypothetical protein VGI70_10315 [Polyangiales bacterium]